MTWLWIIWLWLGGNAAGLGWLIWKFRREVAGGRDVEAEHHRETDGDYWVEAR